MKILRITTVPISLNVLLKGQLNYMRKQGFEIVAASADGDEVAELKARENVAHYIIPFTRTISPFKDLVALVRLILLIQSLRPDIVHTHTPKAGLIGMVAARLTGVAVRMHTVAGMPLMEARGPVRLLLRLAERITYRYATRVYPNSHKLKQWMIDHLKVSPSKLDVLANGSSNGIDVNYFKPDDEVAARAQSLKRKLGIGHDDTVFLFVGRLVRDKGINELVSVFQRLSAATSPNSAKLLLVGAFEDQREPVAPSVKKIIAENDHIIHTGFQADIRPYLAMSDIFVFPSYREGFPNVVLQAACFHLPCIVTDINGCNEIIADNETGLLIAPGREDQLQEAMEKLIEDTPLLNSLKSKARESVILKYDRTIVWQAILKEYKRLLTLHYV